MTPEATSDQGADQRCRHGLDLSTQTECLQQTQRFHFSWWRLKMESLDLDMEVNVGADRLGRTRETDVVPTAIEIPATEVRRFALRSFCSNAPLASVRNV